VTEEYNKKFWKELIRVLCLLYLTMLYQLHLFNCGKLCIFFSMFTLLTMFTVLKQWVHYCISIDSTITR